MESTWIMLAVVITYMAITAGISYSVRRASRTSQSFASGGRSFPAVLVGVLLASELIGTTALVGTAQESYSIGISAGWAVVTVAIGCVLFTLLLAHKFKALGEMTISAALAQFYGERVRTASSALMVCALMIISISTYASGGAIISSLLEIDQTWAIVTIGVMSTLYVSVGGMRSVLYTNLLHALMILIAVASLVWVGVDRVGSLADLRAALPEERFDVDFAGWSQIVAWLFAGVGGIFGSQYIVQSVMTVNSRAKARHSGFYAAVLLIPFGIMAAVIGMCSSVLYPHIESIQALPALIVELDPLLAGMAVAGLMAAMLGTAAAVTIGSSTLLLTDFYQRWINTTADPKRDIRFIRLATVAVGLLPILLAVAADNVLAVTFLGKALRGTIAVLVLFMFFMPKWGTGRGAFVSIVLSLIATISWYVAGDPFGVDNAYIAALTPVLVMAASQVFASRRPSTETSRCPDSRVDGSQATKTPQ
jgi:SSS family solute:Na+ symporter